MPANDHYQTVLAELRQVKADAEAGIAAIERLLASNPATRSGPDQGGSSVPQRVQQFLESQSGKSFTISDIVEALSIENIQTLRGALGRLYKSGKIGKHGRGRYRSPRSKAQAEAAP